MIRCRRFQLVGVLLCVALGSNSWAAGGTAVGNGGWGVQCPGQAPELLDIAEAKAERGMVMNLGPESWSVANKLQLAISRLATQLKTQSSYAWDVENDAFLFLEEAINLQSVEFAGVLEWPDALVAPELFMNFQNFVSSHGCALVPIVVRRPPEYSAWDVDTSLDIGSDRDLAGLNLACFSQQLPICFFRNSEIWSTLDSDNRAALALHEGLRTLMASSIFGPPKIPSENELRNWVVMLTMGPAR